MRKVLVSIAALGAALAASPSLAQSYGYPGGGYGQPGYGNGYNQGYGGNRYMVPAPWQVRQMIDRADRSGQLSRWEARRLRDSVRDLDRLYDRAQRRDDYGARREWQRRTFDVLRDLREAQQNGGRDGRWGDRDRDDYRYR